MDITLDHWRTLLDPIPRYDQIPSLCRKDLVVVFQYETRTEGNEILALLVGEIIGESN